MLKNNFGHTNEGVDDYDYDEFDDEKDMEATKVEMGKEMESEQSTMSYRELELATPHQEEAPALEMMYETTLKPQVSSSSVEIKFILRKTKINQIHFTTN